MLASAAWPFRSRSETTPSPGGTVCSKAVRSVPTRDRRAPGCVLRRAELVLGVGLVLGLAGGCSGSAEDAARPRISPSELASDASVVADLAAREGLDEDEAAARARSIAALADRYLQRAGIEPEGDDGRIAVAASRPMPGISDAREAHLLRTARARVWLTQVFEPSHGVDDIPQDVVQRADPVTIPSHGAIQVVCNVVVGVSANAADAAQGQGPALAKDDPQWRERAERQAEAIGSRLRALLPDPSTESDCEVIDRTLRLGLGASADDELSVRVESGGFESCREDSWDPGWVEAICPVTTPRWVGPFWTRFGVHVVAVIKVVEADEYDPSQRDRRVRESILTGWRSNTLGERLARLRREAGVQVVTPADANPP